MHMMMHVVMHMVVVVMHAASAGGSDECHGEEGSENIGK
jgi:hypothetical protein